MKKSSIDTPLAIAIFSLVVFGIIMISSVSVYESYQLTSSQVARGLIDEPSNSYYLWKQFRHVLISIPVWIIAMYLPLKFWKQAALPFFAISILMLVAVLIPGIGADYGTSRSWINLPYLPSVQPAEIVKFTLIFYLAVWMEKRQELVRSFQYGFIPFTILLSIIVLLLAVQPDFGSIWVIGMISVAMFFAAGGSISHIGLGALVAGILAYPVIMNVDYVKKRFLTFINPALDPLGIGFQIKQALIAVGSGGFFGVGFGKSIQKFGYLPEVQGDTIFAAAAEELGFLRITFFVLAYAFIAYRGYLIANNAKDRFSMLVAVGITSWFAFQAIINMGVVLAILPNTGLTLPFVSFGGSSLMITMLAAGVLLNISRHAEEPADFTHRRRDRRAYHSQPRRRVSY